MLRVYELFVVYNLATYICAVKILIHIRWSRFYLWPGPSQCENIFVPERVDGILRIRGLKLFIILFYHTCFINKRSKISKSEVIIMCLIYCIRAMVSLSTARIIFVHRDVADTQKRLFAKIENKVY